MYKIYIKTGLLACTLITGQALAAYTATNALTGYEGKDAYLCFNNGNVSYPNLARGDTVSIPTGGYANYNFRLGGCTLNDLYLGNATFGYADDGSNTWYPAFTGYNAEGGSGYIKDLKFAAITKNVSYNVFGQVVLNNPPKDLTITNNIDYLLCNGVTNPGSVGVEYPSTNKSKVPGILEKGDQVILKGSASGFSGVNFNVRGGTCDEMLGGYYGNVNFSTGPDNTVVASPSPDTFSVNCTAVEAGCNISSINLLPPTQVSMSQPAQSYQQTPGILYRGVNLAGSEFGEFWSPVNTPLPTEVSYYIEQGMNTVRLPIRWAYAQPEGPGEGELDKTYIAFVNNIIEQLTSNNVYVILDLHSYARYTEQGEDIGVPPGSAAGGKPNGTIVTEEQIVDVWSKLMAGIQDDVNIDKNYLIVDITNEPAWINTEKTLALENAVIGSLRSIGFNGLILIEGNYFSGMWSWFLKVKDEMGEYTATPSAEVFVPSNIQDPANNYAINVHQYFDSNGTMSGTTTECLPAAELSEDIGINNFINWLKTNKLRAIVTEFGGAATPSCLAAIGEFVSLVSANPAVMTTDGKVSQGGFIGWTIWSGSHTWGGYNTKGEANYILDVSPNPAVPVEGETQINSKQMETLAPYLK